MTLLHEVAAVVIGCELTQTPALLHTVPLGHAVIEF